MNSAKEIGQCARFSAGFRSSRENIPAHPGRASAVAITYSLRSSSGTPSASSAAAMTIFAGVRSMAIRRKSSSAPRQRRGTEAPEAKSNDTAIKKPSERFGSVMPACPWSKKLEQSAVSSCVTAMSGSRAPQAINASRCRSGGGVVFVAGSGPRATRSKAASHSGISAATGDGPLRIRHSNPAAS